MDYISTKDDFWIYEVKNLEWLDLDWFYSIINEIDYISLICKKINDINLSNFISVDEWYYLLSIKIQYNPNITWILAQISDKLSKEWISFYVITTYNFWHFLISKNLIDKAEKIFKNIVFDKKV